MLLASILSLFVFKALFSLFDTHGRLLLLESFSIERVSSAAWAPAAAFEWNCSLSVHLIVANSTFQVRSSATLHLQGTSEEKVWHSVAFAAAGYGSTITCLDWPRYILVSATMQAFDPVSTAAAISARNGIYCGGPAGNSVQPTVPSLRVVWGSQR